MATELASVIQSAHINTSPSAAHDINPSTAASQKIPATIHHPSSSRSTSRSSSPIHSDILNPLPRPSQRQRMPLPDLRFEQTYLASLATATTTGQVMYITLRDQVFMPLVQGVGYHLLVSGWRFWNRETQFSGVSVGARVRRWWWNVNGWKVPAVTKQSVQKAEDYYGVIAGSGGD